MNDFEGKSDQERIQSLVSDGKITRQEADRLLDALQDTEPVGEPSSVAATPSKKDAAAERHGETEKRRDNSEVAATVQKVLQHEALGEGLNAARAERTQADDTDGLPDDLRWVRVSVLAGDLDIRVDPGLSEPAIESAHPFDVKKDGADYIVSPVKRDKAPRREGFDGLIDDVSSLVGGIVGRVGDLDIRIPEGFGVVLDSKSGDVEVRDVPFVKASLLAGDLDLHEVGGIDLSMSAGDVDASLRLVKGKHRIKLSAGDVDIRLLAGSSVSVAGAVSMGDVHALEPLRTKRSGMGGSLSGRVGDGSASLELSVSAGDLDVRCG